METITRAQAWAIATVLNQASMDVEVKDHEDRPFFTNCSGAEVMAAVLSLVHEGGRIGEELAGKNWLMVAFEATPGFGAIERGFTSLELGWAL
jgi:hypothetical protein